MEELERQTIEAINKSKLSYEAVRYVLKHILDVVDLQYQNALLKAQIPVTDATSINESEVKPDE